MTIGKLGVWALVSAFSAKDGAAFARRVESWGYGALWIPEAFGCDLLVGSAWLLANTTRLTLATGIANIYARDSLATKNAQYGLAELSDGRFLLGLGVSHAPLVEGVRGHRYEKPLPTMRAYLERMAATEYMGPPPPDRPKTLLAALGPGMLKLAGTLADGAHPFNVPPEHTAQAREIMGPDALLCPEQMVVLEKSPSEARAIARKALSGTLPLPNYRNNLLRLGFSEEDCDHGGSDRLIDALVAWGDEDAIRDRIQQHWDAGADHVCIQSLPQRSGSWSDADEKIFELLAPGV